MGMSEALMHAHEKILKILHKYSPEEMSICFQPGALAFTLCYDSQLCIPAENAGHTMDYKLSDRS